MEFEKKFIVSTGSAGALADPLLWRKLWPEIETDERFGGFEMIGWGDLFWDRTSYLLDKAAQLGIKVAGIHGRIGTVTEGRSLASKIRIKLINNFLVSTRALLSTYTKEVDYVLVHQPEMFIPVNIKAALLNKAKIKLLFLENNPSKGSLEKALDKIKELRTSGVNAGLTFDLYHFFKTLPRGEFETDWHETLQKLQELTQQSAKENFPMAVHIPVGTDLGDSFPMEEMTDSSWQDLGWILKKENLRIVIENQQSNGRLFLNKSQISSQVKRNQLILAKLSQTGVI